MLVGFQFLAVLCCTLFAGAAIYISLVEHPARMACDTKTAATVWTPSYKRATVMQAPLAALSFLFGVGAWLFGGGILWLMGDGSGTNRPSNTFYIYRRYAYKPSTSCPWTRSVVD